MCRLNRLAENEPFLPIFDTDGTTQLLYPDEKIDHSLFTPFESCGISLREPRTSQNREEGHFPVLSFPLVQE